MVLETRQMKLCLQPVKLLAAWPSIKPLLLWIFHHRLKKNNFSVVVTITTCLAAETLLTFVLKKIFWVRTIFFWYELSVFFFFADSCILSVLYFHNHCKHTDVLDYSANAGVWRERSVLELIFWFISWCRGHNLCCQHERSFCCI